MVVLLDYTRFKDHHDRQERPLLVRERREMEEMPLPSGSSSIAARAIKKGLPQAFRCDY